MEDRLEKWLEGLTLKVDKLIEEKAESKNKRLECQEHFDRRYARRWVMGNIYMWIMIIGLVINIIITVTTNGG